MNFFGVLLLIALSINQLSASLDPNMWTWNEGPLVTHSQDFTEKISKILLVDNGRWVEPEYPVTMVLPIPGGFCPKDWGEKYDMLYSINHFLNLNYWWKWPGSMVLIDLKTDFRTLTNDPFFLRLEDAMETAMEEIIKEFTW